MFKHTENIHTHIWKPISEVLKFSLHKDFYQALWNQAVPFLQRGWTKYTDQKEQRNINFKLIKDCF